MNASDKNPDHYRRYGIHCAAGSSNCQGASKGTPKNAIFGAPIDPAEAAKLLLQYNVLMQDISG